MKIIILQDVLEGFRNLSVDRIIDLFSTLLGYGGLSIHVSLCIIVLGWVSLSCSSCLILLLVLVRRRDLTHRCLVIVFLSINIEIFHLGILLLIFLSRNESIEPLEGIN